MTIALLVPDLHGRSGYSTYAVNLGTVLAKAGHRVIAIVHENAGVSWCTEVPILGRDTQYLRSPLRCFLSAKRIQRILRKENVDIVHVIAEPYALTLPFVGRGNWKTAITIHGSYAVIPLATQGITRTLASKALMRADHIIAVSSFTKNFLVAQEPAVFAEANLHEKIVVIPNSVDLARAGKRVPRHDADPYRILSVGAIKTRKGYLEAVEACAAFVKKTGHRIQYDIIGPLAHEPSFTATLRSRIHALGMDDMVRLRGEVSDDALRAAYASADLFLLLSKQEGLYFEGFGLVFLEANTWGVPVIGPNTGGCPEAIRDGISGYVCDPADALEVASRMEDILLHGSIREEDCRAWAEEHSTEKIGEQILRLYSEF